MSSESTSAEFRENLTQQAVQAGQASHNIQHSNSSERLEPTHALSTWEENEAVARAIEQGQLKILRSLLTPKAENERGVTLSMHNCEMAIRLAIEQGQFDTVRLLFRPKNYLGLGFTLTSYIQEIAFNLAIEKNQLTMVKLLFMRATHGGFGIRFSSTDLNLTLMEAIKNNQFDVVKIILAPESEGGHGLSSHTIDRHNYTVSIERDIPILMEAIKNEQFNIVNWLLKPKNKEGYGLRIFSFHMQEAVTLALETGQLDMLKLLSSISTINDGLIRLSNKELKTAIKSHQYDILKWLLTPRAQGGYGVRIYDLNAEEGHGLITDSHDLTLALKAAIKEGPQMVMLFGSIDIVQQILGDSCIEAAINTARREDPVSSEEKLQPYTDKGSDVNTPSISVKKKYFGTSYPELHKMISGECQKRTKQLATNSQQRGLTEFNEAKKEFEASLQTSLHSFTPTEVEEVANAYHRMKLRHEVKAGVLFNPNAALATLYEALTRIQTRFPTLKLEKLLDYYGELNPKLRYALKQEDQALFKRAYKEYRDENLEIEKYYRDIYRNLTDSSKGQKVGTRSCATHSGFFSSPANQGALPRKAAYRPTPEIHEMFNNL
jgi:hypothetical protein